MREWSVGRRRRYLSPFSRTGAYEMKERALGASPNATHSNTSGACFVRCSEGQTPHDPQRRRRRIATPRASDVPLESERMIVRMEESSARRLAATARGREGSHWELTIVVVGHTAAPPRSAQREPHQVKAVAAGPPRRGAKKSVVWPHRPWEHRAARLTTNAVDSPERSGDGAHSDDLVEPARASQSTCRVRQARPRWMASRGKTHGSERLQYYL